MSPPNWRKDSPIWKASFRALIRCVSEVDALLSLAFASQAMSTSCQPELVANEETEPATVAQTSGVWPKRMGKKWKVMEPRSWEVDEIQMTFSF